MCIIMIIRLDRIRKAISPPASPEHDANSSDDAENEDMNIPMSPSFEMKVQLYYSS